MSKYKNPGFLCDDFIRTNSNMPQHQKSFKQQCHTCMDKVIEHHAQKAVKEKNKNK